jgi:N-acetyl-alpha-D-muramate 1-phosphate uridylyltransferase
MKKAMILAAGLGRRMQHLTADCPKPLLQVKGKALIEYVLWGLQRAGVEQVVINVHYHAEQIMQYLGDGSAYQLDILYSHEKQGLLGTGGGIYNALPLLGNDPFICVSADIFTAFDFSILPQLGADQLAHLVLVNNPEYKPHGDFSLQEGLVGVDGFKFTYANIAVLSPKLFANSATPPACLAPLLFQAVDLNAVAGEFYNGFWFNVGTPEILDNLNQHDAIPQLGGCRRDK